METEWFYEFEFSPVSEAAKPIEGRARVFKWGKAYWTPYALHLLLEGSQLPEGIELARVTITKMEG